MLAFASMPAPPPPLTELRTTAKQSGVQLRIGTETLRSNWRWYGGSREPDQLWLPLELLEAQLGFRRTTTPRGDQLEWFGRSAHLASLPTQILGDEVGLEVSDWLRSVGIRSRLEADKLILSLPAPVIHNLRRGKGVTANRVVLDLSGPALVQRRGDDLLIDVQTSAAQRRSLRAMGVAPKQHPEGGLLLSGQAARISTLSLAKPWRIVLDGVQAASAISTPSISLPLHEPAVATLLRKGFVLDRRTLTVGVKPIEIFRAGGDLKAIGLQMRPLAMTGQQQGLRFLPQLSQPSAAVIAVNGGFFNRITQLPLGALRLNGSWLSGPILNRGAIAWGSSDSLQFGRLQLHQDLIVNNRRRWRLDVLNSGYVKRGLSLYTQAWGSQYRALSGEEQAFLIRAGEVVQRFDQPSLNQGVTISSGTTLVVARGGTALPARVGDTVKVATRKTTALAEQPNVLGGGPLLMNQGQVVLNGRIEGFSPAFLQLSAPRTVVGQGPSGQWLLTLRGSSGGDPTLLETALACRQLGLHDALNLDGGSSTTLVVAGQTVMNGRGGSPRVHNGLGLVNR